MQSAYDLMEVVRPGGAVFSEMWGQRESIERNFVASDFFTGAPRHWRSGTGGLPVRRLAGGRRTADLAGAAPGADRLWRIAVSVVLGIRRQSAAPEPG